MATSIILEQRMGVNPFGNKIEVDKRPETVQKIESLADEIIKKTYAQYEPLSYMKMYDDVIKEIENLNLDILAPAKIDIFLQKIKSESMKSESIRLKLDTIVTGMFISRLMQISHEAGHNQFNLTTNELFIPSLGRNLTYKTGKQPIVVNILGNAGMQCGYKSKNCTYNIQGDTRIECGASAEYCTFNIQGDTGECLGIDANHSIFNIKGDIQSYHRYHDCVGSKNCIYKTSNVNTYNFLLRTLPSKNVRIQFFRTNGKMYKDVKR